MRGIRNSDRLGAVLQGRIYTETSVWRYGVLSANRERLIALFPIKHVQNMMSAVIPTLHPCNLTVCLLYRLLFVRI